MKSFGGVVGGFDGKMISSINRYMYIEFLTGFSCTIWVPVCMFLENKLFACDRRVTRTRTHLSKQSANLNVSFMNEFVFQK